MKFEFLPVFQKEFDRLKKKYRSLTQDLEEFKKVISLNPLGNSKHFDIITRSESCIVLKARFFCKYLKGSSLRIVYSYREAQECIEYIEIYFKGDKGTEDKGRIREYMKNLS